MKYDGDNCSGYDLTAEVKVRKLPTNNAATGGNRRLEQQSFIRGHAKPSKNVFCEIYPIVASLLVFSAFQQDLSAYLCFITLAVNRRHHRFLKFFPFITVILIGLTIAMDSKASF